MHPISWLKGIGTGAVGMFFLDPRMGRRRQALAIDQATHLTTHLLRSFDAATRDLRNRLRGAYYEVVGALDTRQPTDDVLLARVRSKLGRAVSHPHAIEVDVADGVVSLRGPVLADEAECMLHCVNHVRGVRQVEDELSRHDEDEGIAELQGGATRDLQSDVPVFARSPGVRLAAGSLGTLMMLNCAMRRRPSSILFGALGFAMVVQAFSSQAPAGRNGSARREGAGGGKQPQLAEEPSKADDMTADEAADLEQAQLGEA